MRHYLRVAEPGSTDYWDAFFIVLTYMGDFTLWAAFSLTFFIYTFFKSRKHFHTSVQLIFYLALVTVSTYVLKEAFARPRPDAAGITVYNPETFFGIPLQGGLLADLSSFSYPSGHVSRAMGVTYYPIRKTKYH